MTYEEFKQKVSSVILTTQGNCPVTPVIQMLQGKWKLQILYELCIKSPMRFGELKKVLKPITNTALTNALKELEIDDLIQRIQYNEMPLRVEYSLTLKGQDLLPVFYAIMQWGIKYIPLISIFKGLIWAPHIFAHFLRTETTGYRMQEEITDAKDAANAKCKFTIKR